MGHLFFRTALSFAAFSIGILFAAEPNSLQEEINDAVRAGRKEIRLTNKEYRLSRAIRLKNLNNIAIDGNGASLTIVRNDAGAFEITQCDNLSMRNFSIDYDPLPFTQGVVTAADGREIRFRIDRGYPLLTPAFALPYLHVFEPSGMRWKKNCPDVYGQMKILSPEEASFAMREAYPVAVGDRVAINFRSPSAFEIKRCGKLSFCDITVYASPGVVFGSRYGHGEAEFRNIRVIRGPIPAGASANRLLASCADGVNVASSRGGVKVIGCEFSYMGDDGVNFHSELLPIVSKSGTESFDTLYPYGKFKTHFEEVFQPGDRLVFVRPGDYAVIGEAKIAKIAESPRAATLAGRAPEFFPVRGTSGVSCYEVGLDRALSVPEGSFFYVPASGCAGFEVRDNYFHDHRARGIRIMSSDGMISGNRFERIKQCAISLGGEFSHWREAGWVENIVVRDNHMREIGYGMIDARDSYVPGVISTFARLDRHPGTYPGNRNLVIADNVIEDSPGAGIFLYLCRGAELSGNILKDCATSAGTPGAQLGLRGLAPVWIVDSKEIKDASCGGKEAKQ